MLYRFIQSLRHLVFAQSLVMNIRENKASPSNNINKKWCLTAVFAAIQTTLNTQSNNCITNSNHVWCVRNYINMWKVTATKSVVNHGNNISVLEVQSFMCHNALCIQVENVVHCAFSHEVHGINPLCMPITCQMAIQHSIS